MSIDTRSIALRVMGEVHRVIVIQAKPIASGVKLTVRPFTDKRSADCRYWFMWSSRDADKVLHEVIVSEKRASRMASGVLVKLPLDQVEALVGKAAAYLRVVFVDVDVEVRTIRRNVNTAIASMQRQGRLALLNAQYKALRQHGQALPHYPVWLAEQLKDELFKLVAVTEIVA